MAANKNMEVLIIGAGSTGLLLAQGLKQRSIKATVFEREDPSTYRSRPREWGMTLHWGSEFIGKCIPPEMMAKLNKGICCDPYYEGKDLTLPHYNAKTGEKLFDMPGEEPRRISRKKIRNFLSQGIDIQYGKAIKAICKNENGTITAEFADNSTATGSVLIGCDGANSAVRGLLVGANAAKVQDLDIQMFNVSCSFDAETAMLQRKGHPCFKNSYHPDGFMWWQSIQDVEDPSKPETWLFQNIISWIGAPRAEDLPDQAARLAFWQEKAATFADPWKTVGENFPKDLKFGVDRTTTWRPNMDWSVNALGGNVTLAGDAAHTMPPHRGQGLNNALQDAAVLTEQLAAAAQSSGSLSISAALLAYEKEMKSRTLQEIEISIMQAKMVHSFDTLLAAPFFKHGMHKYREDQAGKGKGVEKAMEEKELQEETHT